MYMDIYIYIHIRHHRGWTAGDHFFARQAGQNTAQKETVDSAFGLAKSWLRPAIIAAIISKFLFFCILEKTDRLSMANTESLFEGEHDALNKAGIGCRGAVCFSPTAESLGVSAQISFGVVWVSFQAGSEGCS